MARQWHLFSGAVYVSRWFMIVIVAATPSFARGHTKDEYRMIELGARLNSLMLEWTLDREERVIHEARDQYRLQQAAKGNPVVGQAAIGTEPQEAVYPTDRVASGESLELVFFWIDPATGEPVDFGPEVGSVEWYVDLWPEPELYNPDEPFSPAFWSYLGESSEPYFAWHVSSNEGFEPTYLARPKDAAGNYIEILGAGDCNVAPGSVTALVPEPSGLSLLAFGLLGLHRRKSAYESLR